MDRRENPSRAGHMGAGLAVAACVGLLAASGAGADPPKDSVNGAGLLVGRSINHFALHARSGPLGEDPKGRGHFHDNTDKDGTVKGARFGGPITCLRVDGNRAVLVLDFRNVKNQPDSRTAVLVFVEDNGTLPGPQSPDRIAVVDLAEPTACPDPLSQTPTGALDRGDIRVADA
ncbi:MAG: hypothetical protein ACRDN8_17660 [Thermoleophilaceae bacterium]